MRCVGAETAPARSGGGRGRRGSNDDHGNDGVSAAHSRVLGSASTGALRFSSGGFGVVFFCFLFAWMGFTFVGATGGDISCPETGTNRRTGQQRPIGLPPPPPPLLPPYSFRGVARRPAHYSPERRRSSKSCGTTHDDASTTTTTPPTEAMLFRGGGSMDGGSAATETTTMGTMAVAKSETAVATATPATTTTSNNKAGGGGGLREVSTALSERVGSARSAARQFRRRQFWALVALRFGFLLLLVPSILFLALSLVFSLLFTVLRVLTLNFAFGDTARVFYATTRATVAVFLSCVTGLLSPIFALFGLVATLSQAALEMAEPLFRMRYKRQMRKLQHLHKLVTDPILLETVGTVTRAAKVVVDAGTHATEAATRQAVTHGRRGVTASKRAIDKANASSQQLVDTLLTSTNVLPQTHQALQDKLPTWAVEWLVSQARQIRESGALEVAATRAVEALRSDLAGAAQFLPYLEALERVRLEQDKRQQEEAKAAKRSTRK